MNIVIPLGGLGQRFRQEGYIYPKPLIKVEGKEIIRWLLDNLKFKDTDNVIIIYNKALNDFNFKEFINSYYPNIKLISLRKDTEGACDTISHAFNLLKNNNEKLLFLDGDTFYYEDILKKARDSNNDKIFYFKSLNKDPIYSYIKINNKNQVSNIEEKIKISNYASVGAYFFKNTEKAIESFKKVLKKKSIIREYYISLVYKDLLFDNKKVESEEVKDFHCLGTPDLVQSFRSKDNQIVCFDLDNTLLTFPTVKGDYRTCKPITKNINFLNNLRKNGHTIIIYTARRMKTHNGNVLKVLEDIKDITLDSLKKHKIQYDKIYFGKPYANIYFDDLAINTYQNLNKGSGFHFFEDNIKKRSFNKLSLKKKEITKSSKNISKLKSEIFYLKNIPSKISSLFPKLTKVTNNSYSYLFIEGKTLSELYVDKLLTKSHIDLLFKKLSVLHDFKIIPNKPYKNIDIYFNYLDKIEMRIKSKEIQVDKNFLPIFKKIKTKLVEYKLKDKGVRSIIHGDPVFSNIISVSNSRLKFIDPRGHIKNQQTIYGDKFYDYSKVYQSIMGYDFILEDKEIDNSYIEEIQLYFKKTFEKNFGRSQFELLRYLTCSLIISLQPFHKKFKNKEYLKLCTKILKT